MWVVEPSPGTKRARLIQETLKSAYPFLSPSLALHTDTHSPLFLMLAPHQQGVRDAWTSSPGWPDFCRSRLRCWGPERTPQLGEGCESPIVGLLPLLPALTSPHPPPQAVAVWSPAHSTRHTKTPWKCLMPQRSPMPAAPPLSPEACANPGMEGLADMLLSSVLNA